MSEMRVSSHAIKRYLWRVPGVADRLRDEILAIVAQVPPVGKHTIKADDRCVYVVENGTVVTILGSGMRPNPKPPRNIAKVTPNV